MIRENEKQKPGDRAEVNREKNIADGDSNPGEAQNVTDGSERISGEEAEQPEIRRWKEVMAINKCSSIDFFNALLPKTAKALSRMFIIKKPPALPGGPNALLRQQIIFMDKPG
jgi:hypothetical protein